MEYVHRHTVHALTNPVLKGFVEELIHFMPAQLLDFITMNATISSICMGKEDIMDGALGLEEGPKLKEHKQTIIIHLLLLLIKIHFIFICY